MNNKEVCEYVCTLDPHKNNIEEKYISDLCVEEGYGQSCGGYLTTCKKDSIKLDEISQKDHFLNYYSDKGGNFRLIITLGAHNCYFLLLRLLECQGKI